MANCKTVSKGLYTTDYISNSMSKETGFIIVGIVNTPEQANEIQGIVKLSILGFHIQDIDKGV